MASIGQRERATQNWVVLLFRKQLGYQYFGDWQDEERSSPIEKNLLGKHSSLPYHPEIANAFFRAGYIESWGRGIEKINRECREHDIAPPLYDYGMSGLMMTFQANPQHLATALGEQETQKTSVKTAVETPVKIVGQICWGSCVTPTYIAI